MAMLPEHKEILLSQSESKTLPEWVEYFENKYTSKQIYGVCRYNDKKIKKISKEEKSRIQSQNSRKWNINQDYFKTWSHNMAYILGFWYADGCIYGGKMIDITVHKKDKYIIKRMADELGYNGPVNDYVDRQASRINFSCVVIYNDLVSLGGTERKSNTIDFPTDIIPKEYLPDFIRGYFDGDGCVVDVKGNRLNSSFCSGSDKFLLELLRVLRQEAEIEGGSFNKQSHTIVFGKKDSIKLANYMYQSIDKENGFDMYLERKKDKFFKYL